MPQLEILPPSGGFDAVPRIEVLESNIRRNRDSGHKCFFAVGCNLLEAKALLPHGEFGEWLRNKFSMSLSTAQRYMRFARATQRLCGTYGLNTSSLTYLPMEAVVAFWDAPTNIRDQLAHAIQVGYKPTETQVYDQIFKRHRRGPRQMQFDADQLDQELDARHSVPQMEDPSAARQAIAILVEFLSADDFARFKALYAKAGPSFDMEFLSDAAA